MSHPTDAIPQDEKTRLAFYRQAFGIDRNSPCEHNRLGRILLSQGKTSDAGNAFRWAVALRPDYAEAHHNLGIACAAQGKHDKALEAYQEALRLDPDNETTAHLSRALSGERSSAPPENYIRTLFDQYADTFDKQLTRSLHYQVPILIREALLACLPEERHYDNVMDLGCVTGLVGLECAGLAGRLSGIDLSENMLERARDKGIYQVLRQGDICSVLDQSRETYDLFLAGDVLGYMGDLEELFYLVRRRSSPRAPFVFTTEISREEDYLLQKCGRYAHSRRYIARLAATFGFAIPYVREITLRREKVTPVPGNIFVLRQGGR